MVKEDHELIQHGPYAYVRHPIYSGLILMAFGLAVISGRIGAFAVAAFFSFGFLFQARREERLLTAHFLDAYPKYKARVKALIPYIL